MSPRGPLVWLGAATAFTVPAAAQAPNLAVETPPAAKISVAAAIETGVAFLVDNQNADGSFGKTTSGRTWEVMASVPGSLDAFRVATTALCWMGLRDVPHRTPASEACARKALAWLVEHARAKRPNGLEMYNIWALSYGLRAICQAIDTHAEGAAEPRMREVAESLIDALALYQTPDGGIGYYDFKAQTYRPSDSSMSFSTGTMLIGLHAAEQVGLSIPERLLSRALKSVRTCRKEDGSYLYGPYLKYHPNMGINQPKGSSLRTQTCNMALYLFGSGVSVDDLRQGLDMLETHHRFAIAGVRRPIPHESWYQVSGYFYLYGLQYAALVIEKLPLDEQKQRWPFLVRATLQAREPDGSYWDYPLYGFHKFYGTGFALMTLGRCPVDIAATIEPPPQ